MEDWSSCPPFVPALLVEGTFLLELEGAADGRVSSFSTLALRLLASLLGTNCCEDILRRLLASPLLDDAGGEGDALTSR